MSSKKTASSRKKTQATKAHPGGLTVAHAAAAVPETLPLQLAYSVVPGAPPRPGAPRAVPPPAAPAAAAIPAASVAPAPLAAAPAAPTAAERPGVDAGERRTLIARIAYTRAQRAGLGHSDPLQDWLSAEREVDAMLARMAG
jgi:hypothetical protein